VDLLSKIEELKKAIEAGGYNTAPGQLTQGGSLQHEDLSTTMNVTTFEDRHIKLQKLFKVVPAKGTLVQYNRQLDRGPFGGSAVLEGAVGAEHTTTYVREVTPMCYYAEVRRVTEQANLIESFDGVKAEDRVEIDAALKIAGDVEFDLFRGKSMFSNNGVFDGSAASINPNMPNILGLDPLIRRTDTLQSTQDLMFNEYGSNISVQFNQAGVLSQPTIEDMYATSAMHLGMADHLYIDPLSHSGYNKISHAKERIVLAGSPQQSTAASLKEQWVAGGAISIESSRFLSAKTLPMRPQSGVPAAPTFTATEGAAAGTSFNAGDVYIYYVTASNELGESQMSSIQTVTVATSGDQINLVITPASGVYSQYFSVYRSAPGAPVQQAYFIGRVTNAGGTTQAFTDLNNRLPGGVSGFMLDMRGMEMPELASYRSRNLAQTDLTIPKVYYRFVTLAAKLPRFCCIVDNLTSS
jgi:hypothetical protein